MAESVLAIQAGFDYQSYLFWTKACEMFLPNTKVKQVAYELDDVKAFDDVVVTFSEPMPDYDGGYVSRSYYQAKFHTDRTKPVTHTALADPAYIGATQNSFLKKLQLAHQGAGEDDLYLYYLYSPSPVAHRDILAKLIGRNGVLDLDQLFRGKTVRSATGSVRGMWAGHLGVTDSDLKVILSRMRIMQGLGTTQQIREDLNQKLLLAGLEPLDLSGVANPYDDLIRKIHGAGFSTEFTKEGLEKHLQKAGLWRGTPSPYPRERTIGIRSFLQYAEDMPNLTSAMLCLVPAFSGRPLRGDKDWNRDVLTPVTDFVDRHAGIPETIYVLLDTHISVAFAAGAASDPKGRATFVPVQKSMFREPEAWPVGRGQKPRDNWVRTVQKEDGSEIALAISVTHAVTTDVAAYVQANLGECGIESWTIKPQPGRSALENGDHAFAAAEELSNALVQHVKAKGLRHVHIFAAAPVAFMFYLGRQLNLPSSCRLTMYEYDFDTGNVGAYTPSVSINGE